MNVSIDLIKTDAAADTIVTEVESEKVSVRYYPLSVSTFACFPQITVEGMGIDGFDV